MMTIERALVELGNALDTLERLLDSSHPSDADVEAIEELIVRLQGMLP